MIKLVRENILIILIVILAIALHFSYIDYNPPSLNWDEISHGYNAYSILKTGKDEWGITLPTIFRAYGDYKLPVYIYLTAISEALFGLTPFAIRLISVLSGIGTVIFTYLLTKRIFDKKIAVFSSFLVAVEPWSLFLSRAAFEANLSLFFVVSGVYFFLLGMEKYKYFLVSVFLLGLSLWTYNSARVFTPLLILALVFLYKKEPIGFYREGKKIFFFCLLIFALLFVPMFFQLLKPVGQARYGKVSVINQGSIDYINELRGNSKLPNGLPRLVYNKATFFTSTFIKNWTSHYSSDFLFFRGGSNYQFSVPNNGLIYLVDILPLLIGILFLIKAKTKENFLILIWFFLGPVASSLTNEAPHVLRSIVILPTPMIITAVGVVNILNWLRTRKLESVFLAIYLILVMVSLENYLKNYFVDYRRDYSWSWQYGYKEVVDYTRTNYGKYDKIIVTKKYGEPHEFFLFFWPWDPAKYRRDPNLIRFYQSDWYWVDRFDKFYFVNDWQIPKEGRTFVLESKGKVDCISSKCLLISSPGNYPKGWKKLEIINFLDGKGAFEIYENY